MSHEHPLWTLLDKLQMDHRAMGALITEVRAQVAALELRPPTEVACECGLKFRSERKLAEHAYISHGGPEPQHWLDTEARSADPVSPLDDEEQLVESGAFKSPVPS